MTTSTRDQARSGRRAVAEAAAMWCARLDAPSLTAAERRQFEAWRGKNPAHAEALELHRTALAAMRDRYSRDTELQTRLQGPGSSPPDWRPAAIAAALVLCVLAGAGFAGRLTGIGPKNGVSAPVQVASYDAGAAARTVTLIDGSVVTLNRHTRIETRFGADRRDIRLSEGEALFKVAKDPARPFTVATGSRSVIAVGTEFNVRFEPQLLAVTMVEGVVQVGRSGERIVKGEQYRVANGRESVAVVDVGAATGWTRGRIFFDDTPLGEAVAEVNRYTDEPIVVTDPQLRQYRLSGMFHTDTAEKFADALTEYLPVRARQSAKGELIIERR